MQLYPGLDWAWLNLTHYSCSVDIPPPTELNELEQVETFDLWKAATVACHIELFGDPNKSTALFKFLISFLLGLSPLKHTLDNQGHIGRTKLYEVQKYLADCYSRSTIFNMLYLCPSRNTLNNQSLHLLY